MALRVVVRLRLSSRGAQQTLASTRRCWRTFSCATRLPARELRRNTDRKANDIGDSSLSANGRIDSVPKRKAIRSPAASLEAKRTRQAAQEQQSRAQEAHGGIKNVTAYCAAEEYLIDRVGQVLRRAGYVLDPFQTSLSPDVVHFQMPAVSTSGKNDTVNENPTLYRMGDVFVFPSGTVVAWDVNDGQIQSLLNGALQEAAVNPHPQRLETEDLDYFEDPASRKSGVVGDTLRIGTQDEPSEEARTIEPRASQDTDMALTKIAFSSALARSTKVAVLESLLDAYFASTQALPGLLSRGVRLPRQYSRRFILRKTGELLSVRAQLNLTELTDRTPDLFWETRHELGLEGYFEQTSRALDLNWRIKVLNERLDYAREIAEVLREELKGRHGELLEWLIIGLIAVEVGVEGWKLLREWAQGETTEELARRYLQRRLADDDGT